VFGHVVLSWPGEAGTAHVRGVATSQAPCSGHRPRSYLAEGPRSCTPEVM